MDPRVRRARERTTGRRVVNAYHVPAVMPRPGIGVFFNRCGPTDNMVISWIEGAVTEDEVTRLAETVRAGLDRAAVPSLDT